MDTPSAEREMEKVRQKISTMTGGAADMSQEEIQKIKQIVESRPKIPRVIIIRDQNGIEQEYEVFEESEEESSVNMSAVRSDGELRSLRVIKRGEIQNFEHSGGLSEDLSSSARKRKRVMVDIESAIEESFYIEEVIEESEEESDSLDDLHKRDI